MPTNNYSYICFIFILFTFLYNTFIVNLISIYTKPNNLYKFSYIEGCVIEEKAVLLHKFGQPSRNRQFNQK